MTFNENTPYNNLTPSLILNAIDSLGYKCSGSLSALNSYENRVYQIGMEDSEPLIAKFYRPGRWSNAAIIEEHQFAQELQSHEIPVVAPLAANGTTLHTFDNFRFALFPRKSGRALELDSLEQLEWMGRFIGRMHAIGATQVFHSRLRIDVESYGYKPFKMLLENDFLPLEIKQEYCQVVETILRGATEISQQIDQLNYIRLHGDCHVGNVLWKDTGPQIVDLDDCLMGPAIQDIWMLLSGDDEQDTHKQLSCILRGYRIFYDFDNRELKLIEVLRTLRQIHYSAWLAMRWDDPTFPKNFPWFNTQHYWQEQLQNLKEQQLRLNKLLAQDFL